MVFFLASAFNVYANPIELVHFDRVKNVFRLTQSYCFGCKMKVHQYPMRDIQAAELQKSNNQYRIVFKLTDSYAPMSAAYNTDVTESLDRLELVRAFLGLREERNHNRI
eukprot:TRINITY_DN2585_c0_g1_i5.p1 TRINITY_DN2585_c0_g1~~TRINITY_DN2585_c0_g1_i5.p1  ORF type:complete len:109 (+),score=11.88 TRINITY_DN2585_c0_g1_i5:218-544(+)